MATRLDEALISSLFETHGAALLAYASRVHGGAKAEDVVHDVLVRAWREVHAMPHTRMAVRAWLFAMVGKPKRGFVPVSFPRRRRTAQFA